MADGKLTAQPQPPILYPDSMRVVIESMSVPFLPLGSSPPSSYAVDPPAVSRSGSGRVGLTLAPAASERG
jgi:hypothetical protein